MMKAVLKKIGLILQAYTQAEITSHSSTGGGGMQPTNKPTEEEEEDGLE